MTAPLQFCSSDQNKQVLHIITVSELGPELYFMPVIILVSYCDHRNGIPTKDTGESVLLCAAMALWIARIKTSLLRMSTLA